jgi:hypothetical protein
MDQKGYLELFKTTPDEHPPATRSGPQPIPATAAAAVPDDPATKTRSQADWLKVLQMSGPRREWGWASEIASGLVQGRGPEIKAGATLWQNAPQLFTGDPTGHGIPAGLGAKAAGEPAPGIDPQADLKANFEMEVQRWQDAKTRFETVHPWGKTAEFAASLPGQFAVDAGILNAGNRLALRPGASALENFAGRTTANVVAGGTTGAMQNKLTPAPLGEDIGVGAAAAAALPVLGLAWHLPALWARHTIDPSVLALARDAAALGVELRPGQLTMSHALKLADDLTKGSKNTTQLRDFTAAVSRTFGDNTPRITEETLEAAQARIQANLNLAAANTQLTPDREFLDALDRVQHNITTNPDLDAAAANDLMRMIGLLRPPRGALTATMPGEVYQAITNRGETLDLLQHHQSPRVRQYASAIRDALEDGIERHSTPEYAELMRASRDQYKNMMVVQKVWEATPTAGLLNPKTFLTAVKKNYADFGWEPPTDISTLGKAGAFLAKPNEAGTAAERGGIPLSLGPLVTGTGGVAAITYGMNHPGEVLTAGGILGGAAAAGKAAGNLLVNPEFTARVGTRTGIPLRPNLLLPVAVGAGTGAASAPPWEPIR